MSQSIWLVDTDNQSPRLASQTAALLGWPHTVILAGLENSLQSWATKAGIPSNVEVERLVSPPIADGADVLLAMAAGRWVGRMVRAIIFSRDKLVAGTLGKILHAQGTSVLAVSSMDHSGLPYPHLTLPITATTPSMAQVKSATKCIAAPIHVTLTNKTTSPKKAATFSVAPAALAAADGNTRSEPGAIATATKLVTLPDEALVEKVANATLLDIFKKFKGKDSASKNEVAQALRELGYKSWASRQHLIKLSSEFTEKKQGSGTMICRIISAST